MKYVFIVEKSSLSYQSKYYQLWNKLKLGAATMQGE